MVLEALYEHLLYLPPQKEATYPIPPNSDAATNVRTTVDAVRKVKPYVTFLLIEMPRRMIIRRTE